MKRLVVIGLLAASLAWPAAAQIVGPPNVGCNKTTGLAISVGTAIMVPVQGTQGINICGFIVSATAAATFQLVTGTGGLCATNQQTITAAHAIPAGNFISYSPSRAQWSSPPGNAVCAIVGGTGPIQATLFYSQF